jgi:hypothetical protein
VLGSIPNTRGKKKIKDKNLMLISIAAEKYLTKLNILSRKKKKNTEKNRTRRSVPQHNRGYT